MDTRKQHFLIRASIATQGRSLVKYIAKIHSHPFFMGHRKNTSKIHSHPFFMGHNITPFYLSCEHLLSFSQRENSTG
jgi:hypothetical protein